MTNKEPLDLSKLTKRDFPFIDRISREQEDMVIKLFKHKRVIVDSVAGSGKTSILTQAMKALKDNGHIDTIYYVVFPVQEESLGYLPGHIPDKIKEYAIPFFQALVQAGVNPQGLDLDRMCDELIPGDYKVVPHTFLRGRTIDNAGIIVDEVQNGTVKDLKKTFTRITDNCYIGISGHTGQSDIPNSGFPKYMNHFKRGKESGFFTDIEFAELTHDYRGNFSSFCDSIVE